jgi:hypothetical protein
MASNQKFFLPCVNQTKTAICDYIVGATNHYHRISEDQRAAKRIYLRADHERQFVFQCEHLEIQTPLAPIVHPKMNSGKEFPQTRIQKSEVGRQN